MSMTIYSGVVTSPTAWITSVGTRYVAFAEDADVRYVCGNGGWSEPMLIKADRTNPIAIRLAPSNDVMVGYLDGSTAKCVILTWNGSSYDVGTEHDITSGIDELCGFVLLPDGRVSVFFVSDGDVQTFSSDARGESWI